MQPKYSYNQHIPLLRGTNTMPFRFWKGMAERTTEIDRVVMFSLRMYLKIRNTHCNKSPLLHM